jgi:hypothetical protein
MVCTIVPVFAQASFTDLTNHWAKDDMEDLVKRGYLSGYSDNTMQPDKNMTACELLVMLSRFYTLSDIQKEKITLDYQESLENSVPSNLTWAKDNLAICLAAGVISENELKQLNLGSEIGKQQLAVYLVRAMQLSNEADELNESELTYTDASKISDNCLGSVAELSLLGIVKGDAKNRFSPASEVNRAVVATMISRSIKYIEKNEIKLTIKAYEGLMLEKGIIISVSNNNIQIKGFDGMTREYTIPSTAKVTIDGTSKTLSSTYEGCYAQLYKNNGVVSEVRVEKRSSVGWIQGTISSINASKSSLNIKDSTTGKTKTYTVPSKASILQEGKSVSLSSLSKSNFYTIKTDDSIVTEVYSTSCDFELNGTISEVNYGTSITLKIVAEEDAKYCFLLDITDLPTIRRGETTISIDRLKAGNEVTAVVKNSVMTSISAKGAEDKFTGKLTSTTTTANGTVWNLSASDGTTRSLMLDEGVAVYSGKTAILLSAVHVGDEVSVVIYGNLVTEIYLQSAVSSSNKVIGRVLTTDKKVITILTSSEKLVYVNISSALIVNASTGKTITVSKIEKNSDIVAYGSYKNSTDFSAELVVIE